MNEQKQIEAMARLEFVGCCYRSSSEVYQLTEPHGHSYPCFYAPAYLTDHNAVQRVIDGLEDQLDYHGALLSVLRPDGGGVTWFSVHKATCAQKCEAILKAKGEWE